MYNENHFVNFLYKSDIYDYINVISQNVIFMVCDQSHLLKPFSPKIFKNQNFKNFKDFKVFEKIWKLKKER